MHYEHLNKSLSNINAITGISQVPAEFITNLPVSHPAHRTNYAKLNRKFTSHIMKNGTVMDTAMVPL